MVAVVTGNNLGLVAGSAGVLGSNGQLGSAATGRGGDAAFVNATTGNLTIQRQDELLIGLGPDIGIVRTYNSKGTFDFDNNDNWQISLYRRVFGLTGTANTAGSTIRRTGADGAELIYTYDTTLANYVNKDGSGSFKTLTYNAGTNAWTWVNGDSRSTETYELQTTGTYRIKTLADSDGNVLTYTYDAATSLITEVADANGEKTQLIYNTTTKQLSQINIVNSSSVTTTRVRYTYDTNTPVARLIGVSTDLTPADGSVADGNAYVTTYVYVGTGNLVASITNSDGTKTSFTYDASNRVATVTDGTGYVTNFAYPSSTTATITDAASQVTTLTYSAVADGSIGQLTGIQGPSGSGQNILYAYDSSGNVTQMTDSRGNVTKYTYDANGNQTRKEDALGNTITRTFSATNQLLSETVYATPDTAPGDATYNAALPQTTRYVYDAVTNNQLRFIISPEGRVTEYQYNAVGQRIASIQYAGLTSIATNLYTTAGTPTEVQMTSWAGATDKTKTQRSDYSYDVRGQLSTRSTYTTVNAAGAGVIDATTATTQYVYDQNGNLLQAIDARGVATTAISTDFITSYSYDGLNRLISQSDALGNVSTSVFDDTSNRQVKVTLANGLVTTSSYDAAGRLLSVSNGQAATPTALGTTSYLYNNLGQLRQSTDPTGQKAYYIYDSLGRKVGAIDPQLALTEYVYNNNNQVVRIVQYTNAVTATLNDTTALTITLATVRPVLVAATDRLSRNLYDKAGRLAKQIDAIGAVTEYQYDGASRLIATIAYANLLSAAQLNALAALSTEPLPTDVNTIPVADATNDRRVRQFYSDDGLLAATLDAEGFLTENIYNAAGQRIQSIRYATITPSAQWAAGALTALRPALDINNDQTSYNIYNARGQLEGTVDPLGYLTEFQYDTVGNRTLTTRYATSITYTVGASVAASRPADALSNTENQSANTTYDANNRVSSNTSAPGGLITNYSYDTVGNLTQKVNTFSGATALDNRSQFKQYDQLGRVTRELSGEGVLALQALVSPTQVQIDAVWDSYGNRYTYDLAGRVITATMSNGTNGAGNKTLYYYDNEGKLKYQVNALGEVTQYSYNNFDNRTTTRQYNTRIAAATLATMTGGFATAADATVTALVAGGYSDTLAAYSNLGQATTLTDALANANSRSYNAFGELKDTTNKIDASTTLMTNYAYDRRGMVKTTTEDSAGINRITSAIYDAFGRITQTTDGRGGIVKRSYDKLGREVSVLDANSNAASLTANNSFTTYDAFSRVLTRKDGRGVAGTYNSVSYVYDTVNRKMTMTSAEGVSMVTTKNRFGETVQITDGRNNVSTYTYNTDGQLKSTTTDTGTVANPTNSTSGASYDAAGHVTTTTDARGINTTFTYDAANRVLSRSVDPTGLNITTQYSYDALGRQTWVKDAKGVWTRTDYDAKGQVTSMVVDPTTIPVIDAAGNITGTTANAAGVNITTNFTYDARGKRLTVVEGAGSSQPKTTQYTYDKLGRLTQTAIDPAGLNLRTSYTYDKNDNVVLKADANGNKTVYSYDANNRLIYSVDALGDVIKSDYDIDGNLLTTTKYATPLVVATLTTLQATPSTAIVPTVNVAADLVTRNVYDKDNRRTFGIDTLGYVTKYEYDANRNVTKTTKFANAMVGIATAGVAPQILATAGTGNYVVTNSNDQVTQMTYDAANRAIQCTDALGNITSYTYDANGNQLSVTEGVGTASQRITRQEFDAMGRKTAAVDALGYRTETTYDALGNIVTVKDARGNIGYFYYDAASRMTLQVNPEGAVTETLYNALGNQTDVIRYATKFVGTPTAGTRPTITANANLDQRQIVTYDAASRKLNIKTAFANTGGQTLDSTAGTGNAYIESFTYDAFGNVLTSIARNGASTTYTYDRLNRKATETLPINSKNASNVLTAVQNSFIYDAFGNLSTKTEAVGLPEQRITTYSYNLNNQQVGESVNVYLNPTTTSVAATKAKTYDARGNVTSETDANAKVTYYYYDLQNRRTAMVDASNVLMTMSYDAVGNKVSQTTYANQVSGQTTTNQPSPTLDAVNDRSVYYTYDAVGRETKNEIRNMVVGSVNTSSNTYNALTTANISKQTGYDGNGNISKIIDANGNITRAYYNNAGEKVAEVDASGYLSTWTRDAYGNITTETKYATKLSAAATNPLTVSDSTTLAQITTTASTLGDTVNDRATNKTYDRLSRVLTEARLNVAQGTVNTANGVLTQNTATATMTYVYDGLNNLSQKTSTLYTDASNVSTNAITNWSYDAAGRQTNQSDPVFTDNTGNTAARKRTDKEYDGLNNLKRTILRGTNDAVETDDEITTYSYSTGGRLISETNALGVVTQYEYDNTGNIVKKTLVNRQTADQAIANTVGGNDITLYSYDNVNRQLTTSTKSTAETTYTITQVEYNPFGQVAKKATYTNTTGVLNTTLTTPDEFAQYDQAGRVFKTNSEDGIIKVMAYDANGNVTIKVTSTDASNSIANTINSADGNLATSLQTLLNTPNTLRTMSVYNEKNQLTTTLQASMDSSHTVAAITTSTTTETASSPANPLTGSVTGPNAANPINAGTLNIGGQVNWSYYLAQGTAVTTSRQKAAVTTVTIPPSLNFSGGDIKVNLYMTSSGSPPGSPPANVGIQAQATSTSNLGFIIAGSSSVTIPVPLSYYQSKTGYESTYLVIYSFRMVATDSNGIVLVDKSWGAQSSGTALTPSKFYINNQPPATSRVAISYRPLGSSGAYTTVSAPQIVNTTGTAISGMFAFDYSALAAGAYEFSYVALDASGNVLNQQSGMFNTAVANSAATVTLNAAKTLTLNPPNTATLIGNSLVKTGGTASWTDAGAFSQTGFTGSAYVSAVAGQTNMNGMIALNSDPMTDKSYTSLDYAWYPTPGGSLLIYENGTNIGTFGTYTTTDVLAIQYTGTTVNYLKNGVVMRTVATTVGRKLYMDSSMYETGFTFNAVKFGADAATATDVVINTDNALVKTGGTNAVWGDAGVSSQSSFTGSAYVSARADQANLYGMFGLNSDPLTDKNYTSLDYAWYPSADGNLYVYESGVATASLGTYTPADVLAVEYTGTAVNYYKNGAVIRSVATTAGRTFWFDSSFYSTGYRLDAVKFGATAATATDIVLNTDNSLTNTGGTNAVWNSDAYSISGSTGSAYVSARADQTNLDGMIGLNSDPMTDKSYTSLDYAIQAASNGNLYIYENGTSVLAAGYGTYTTADVLAVEYTGSTINYYKNGTVIRSVATTAGRTLYMDSSFYGAGFTFDNVKFGATAVTATEVNATTATVTATVLANQVTLASGGIGRALLDNTGLQLINQGSNADHIVMKYRLLGGSTYTTMSSSFVKNTASTGIGLDGFTLASSGLSVLANSSTYEVDYEIYDTGNNLLRISSQQIVKDAAGNLSLRDAYGNAVNNSNPVGISLGKLRLTQSTNAAYVEVATRLEGTTGAYSTPIRIYPTAVGNGLFDWDIRSIAAANQDVQIKSYNSSDQLIDNTQAHMTFAGSANGLTSAVVNSVLSIANPQLIGITPVGGNTTDYVVLGYRIAGSNDNYTMLPAQKLATLTGGAKDFRVNIPLLAAGTYEYQYTAFAPDVADPNNPNNPYDPANPSSPMYYAVTPLGTSSGTFTMGTGPANTRLDWALNTATSSANIQRKQSYNAFGDVVTETDGNGNVTSFNYNTLDKLTKKTDASVSVTANDGTTQLLAAVTTYTYDAIGRMIAVTDANNNTNTQAWLAGGSGDAQTSYERHADGGIKTRQFDVFGNKRVEIDEVARRTDFTYDLNNQLTRIDRPQRLSTVAGYLATRTYDSYGYDAAGNRLTHFDALNDLEKTNYDSLGRVIQTISNAGYSTTYTYNYTTAIIGLGGATVSGWIKTTTDSVGRTLVDNIDMFNRTFNHKDLGGHTFVYSYNLAGWLMAQTGSSGQNIVYDHYSNGFIKSIQDKALGMYTYYEYDANGNKRFEGYASLKDKTNVSAGFADFYQQATISYDGMNRMTSVVDPKATITYQYDAVGNRREVKSTYTQIGGSLRVQEYWYKYDSMNRFLITMGSLNAGVISKGALGSAGVDISYNLAGERVQAVNAIDGSTETYTYTADGYLADVNINGVLRARRTNDAIGRVTNLAQYDANGVNNYNKATSYDKDNRVTQDTGTDGTTNYTYSANGGELARITSVNGSTTINTYYGYQLWDDAKQATITNQGYNPALKGNNGAWAPGFSDIGYDVNGHVSTGIDRAGNRNFRYITDAQGLILVRDEVTGTIARPGYSFTAANYNAGSVADKVNRYYYVDGKRVGDVSNDGPSRTDYVTSLANRTSNKGNYANWKPVQSADFDQNYEPISPTYPGAVATRYTVKSGDTLQSIARTVWGDASMWYLLADANGLASGQSLVAGMSLIVPNKVTNIHNNAGTFRPYNPGEAMGDINPTLPTMPNPPVNKKGGCGGLGAIIAAVVSVVATYVLGPIGGNIVSQVFNNVIGIQKGFSFSSFAMSVVNQFGGLPQANLGNPIASAAANAAISNVAGQGLAIISGEQKGFSWSSVAASAVGGAVGSYVGGKLDAKFPGQVGGNANLGNNLFKGAVTNIASNVATQLTQIALDGKGKLSWTSVAVSGIYGVGSGYDSYKKLEAQNAVNGANAPRPNQEARDRYLDMSTAGGRGRTDVPVGEARLVIGGEPTTPKDLLGTNPSEGGLSIKQGAAEKVITQAKELNAQNTKNNFPGLDQAISNIAADAVGQYYFSEDLKAQGVKINLERARSELRETNSIQSNPVNWYELGKSSLGIIGNTATIVTGGGLDVAGVIAIAAPDPTTLTKWGGVAALTTGTALIAKGEAGLVLNTSNFLTALKGDKSYLPGSGIELLAQKKFGDSRTVQNLALATDMTIDLLTNPVLGGTKLATNSAGVALKNGVPALFQVPRTTNLIKEFLVQSPQIYKYTNIVGDYSAFGSSLFSNYELGKIDYKVWK